MLPNTKMVGSGPYTLAKYTPGVQTVLQANALFKGPKPKTDLVIMQYFDTSSTLKQAIQSGTVDIAFRSLTPTDLDSLKTTKGVQVLTGASAETRQLQINASAPPENSLDVRRAVAYIINRQSIAQNIYKGTVAPLYSMVPSGFRGHTDAFAAVYGKTPNVAKARQLIHKSGLPTPIDLQVWYTPSHYGDSSADEFIEIQRELEATGLFKVALQSSAWAQYVPAAVGGQYPVYQLGWFGNYPEADDFLFPFYSDHAFFKLGYTDSTVMNLINQEESCTDQGKRTADIIRIQKLVAEDPVLIPLWQGKQIAVVRDGVSGVQQTLDPSNEFRLWLMSKK